MGDQLRLHGDLRFRLGLGRLGSLRLQHGVRRAMVSIHRQAGLGDIGNIYHRTSDRAGCGIGHANVGKPGLATSATFITGQAIVPAAASGMPPLTFPMATLIFFQFVFAAITVIILAGSVLGRMNFTAWMIFCPVWMTFVYTVGAFSLWGGGWLAGMGVADFSGGYVIHLAAGTSGFVAAWVVGPRLQVDRDHFPPNSLLMTLVGAGILWLGWNGFNGGDPYFANADAGAAVLNTNTCTAVALLVWTLLDKMAYGKPSVLGAVNGMIAGLVAITPAAGYV